jgi:hypothetical protein
VPESRKRKKAVYTPPPNAAGGPKKKGPSPPWLPVLMLALFGIGVLWLVVFYISEGDMFGLPGAQDLGNWNLPVGFAFIIAGFGVATQWR